MVHPAIEPFVRAVRERPPAHPSTQSMAQRRSETKILAEALRGDEISVAEIVDFVIPLEHAEILARLYVPNTDERCGLLVYFHGGGFVVGDLDTHDSVCRRLANDTRMRLVAIDYRLAPEFPFPSAIDDAVGVVRYLASHLGNFADAKAKLVLTGDSAGATLAAVAANVTRNEELPIAAQALLYPTIGPELVTQSAHDFGNGFLLETDHMRFDYEQYLGGWSDHSDPRVNLLMNTDLVGVPPAIVVVAQFDPLRDEGISYAGLLEHFGVPVEVLEAEGMVHGFVRLGGVVPEALAILDDVAQHLHDFVARSNA